MWVSKKKWSALQSQVDAIDAKISLLSSKKSLENASYELREFIQDVAEHGCGIVKISPDAIFIRGIRK